MGLLFLRAFRNLQLDIVGFLAILGEGSVLANAEVAFLSNFILLPRLLPAPQALLRPSRKAQLDPFIGTVVGVHSGNYRSHVNYVAHLIHHGDDLPEYVVEHVEIIREDVPGERPVTAKAWRAPLTWAALLGCVESIALLVLSIVFNDGMALLATILLSLLSTLIGYGNKCQLLLTQRKSKADAPPGDVVIKYPNGALVVVKCEESVARELYFAPEKIEYIISNPSVFRMISLVGTLMLMFGVIMLANAKLRMQICFGAAYIILNAAYWTVAALPNILNWDVGQFKLNKLDKGGVPYDAKTFTRTLFKGIQLTESTSWITVGSIAPKNDAWKEWLETALNAPDDWDPQQAINDLMIKHDPTRKSMA